MFWITVILLLFMGYLLAGLAFAVVFLFRGLAIIDENAKKTGWGFRLIIIPGTLVWWPLLLKKWMNKKRMLGGQNK